MKRGIFEIYFADSEVTGIESSQWCAAEMKPMAIIVETNGQNVAHRNPAGAEGGASVPAKREARGSSATANRRAA